MDKNNSLLLASAVFAIIALAHLLRAILGWEAKVDGFNVPAWLSYIVVIVAGYLAWQTYSASRK